MELKLDAQTKNEQLVKTYLENNVSEELANKINNGKKTLKGCWRFITEEAKKQAVGGCACIEDKQVFGWAVHYFEEDSIVENEIKPVQSKVEQKVKEEKKTKSTAENPQISLFDFGLEDKNDKTTSENKK